MLGLSGAGLVSGIAARRMTFGDGAVMPEPARVETKSTGVAKIPAAVDSKSEKSAPIAVPPPVSTDTVEILLALDDAMLYPRLAAWLLAAEEQDIAAYWNGYRSIPNRKYYISDLVFINWTRLNPLGAIAAVAGTKDDYFPWWAWTAHDPAAALAAAIEKSPLMVGWVARGIGGFQPDWLREHLDQIPEASRSKAFSSFQELDDTEEPLDSLKFMKENAMGFDSGIFKNLVQKDPWEALEWLKQNPSLQRDRYSSQEGPLDVLITTMISEYPDDLERLLAQTPSGEMKRKMEAAIFENLLTTDPAAAIAQAKATDSTAIAAERFAKIGLSLVNTDPDQAFEMAKALLASTNGGNSSDVRVDYPGGSMSWGSSDNGSSELLGALIVKDPVKLMQLAVETGVEHPRNGALNKVAHQWANQDIVSYTNWVNQQTDPAIRETLIGPVVNQLTQLGQYTEAIDWARSSGKTGSGNLFNIFYQWERADPAGAAEWLKTSDLPADQITNLQEIMKQSSRNNDE